MMSGRAHKVRYRDGEELCPQSEPVTQVFRPQRKRNTQVSGIRPRPAAFTVTRAERGDTAALTELFRQHQAGLHAYFTGPAHWYWHFVPDLVQETMTRAVEALPRHIDDDFVVYDPMSDTTTLLNVSSAAVLDLCDGTRTLDDMAGEVAKAFQVEPDAVRGAVRSSLDDFASRRFFEHEQT